VLPVAIRRWRSSFLSGRTRGEIRTFLKGLRQTAYDVVIDTQGLLKSALLAYAARGVSYGLDFASAREPLSFLYDRVYSVPWTLHAVERNRVLAAQALGYALRNGTEYGIAAQAAPFEWLPAGRYAVLVHSTSARRKLWAEENWIEFGRRLTLDGGRCVLPWGNAEEHARSERLAGAIPQAIVPPALELGEVAGLMSGAAAVAGVDTGLTHLSGALGVPTAGIYCATDPSATGLYGCARGVNLGGASRPPAVEEVMTALEHLRA
jgi:heptosyltransferase-1